MTDDRPRFGIAYFCAAILLTAIVDAISKLLTSEMHALQIVWGYFAEGETTSGLNRLRATVIESVYLGEMVQLTLQSGAVKLRANVRQRAADEPIARGAAMICTVDPRDVVLLSS